MIMIKWDQQRKFGPITVLKKCLPNVLVQYLTILWEDLNLNFISQAGYTEAHGLIQFLQANSGTVT
jgi:hypothetical protein